MDKPYELVYILRPDMEDEARSAAIERVAQRIGEAGGTVQSTDEWGKRRMAYALGKVHDGHYVLVRLTADGDRIQTLRRSLGLIEDVMRFLIVAAEPAPVRKEAAAAASAPEGGS